MPYSIAKIAVFLQSCKKTAIKYNQTSLLLCRIMQHPVKYKIDNATGVGLQQA